MRIEILGSGGATTTPRPFCGCDVCQTARQRGVPYSRYGPSFFVHDIDLLIDTPEEIGIMLNRSGIMQVEAVLYSHWHPDHTRGIRVWENNQPLWDWPPQPHTTQVYLPQQVAADFKARDSLWEALDYQQRQYGVVEPVVLSDGQTITRGDITIRPFRVAEDYVYAFLLTQNSTNVLIAPDELFGWQPPDWLPPLDLAIVPAGLMEFHPLNGTRLIPTAHPVLQHEATFRQTLDMMRQLRPARTVFVHLDEGSHLSYEDYQAVAAHLNAEQPDLGQVSFGEDQLLLTVG